MRKIYLITLVLVSLTAISQPNVKREIREVTLSGSGYALGLQHGKLLKTEIE